AVEDPPGKGRTESGRRPGHPVPGWGVNGPGPGKSGRERGGFPPFPSSFFREISPGGQPPRKGLPEGFRLEGIPGDASLAGDLTLPARLANVDPEPAMNHGPGPSQARCI